MNSSLPMWIIFALGLALLVGGVVADRAARWPKVEHGEVAGSIFAEGAEGIVVSWATGATKIFTAERIDYGGDGKSYIARDGELHMYNAAGELESVTRAAAWTFDDAAQVVKLEGRVRGEVRGD